jgi:hypothetical protein
MLFSKIKEYYQNFVVLPPTVMPVLALADLTMAYHHISMTHCFIFPLSVEDGVAIDGFDIIWNGCTKAIIEIHCNSLLYN